MKVIKIVQDSIKITSQKTLDFVLVNLAEGDYEAL